MKKILPLICVVFTSVTIAQPTITSSVIPTTGHSSTYREVDATAISPGVSGTAVTWDFSSINMTGSAVFDYTDPSNLPQSTLFPSANLGQDQNGDQQFFYESITNELSIVGIRWQEGALIENYSSNSRLILKFPMTYGTTFNDLFIGTTEISTLLVTRKGETVVEADGYGTLILPIGTFPNALRVRAVSEYKDSSSLGIVNQGTDSIYSWYVPGVTDYVFTWSHIESTAFGAVFYSAFLDTVYVGIDEEHHSGNSLEVSPNPSNNWIQVEYKSNSDKDVLIEVFDLSGRMVKSQLMNKQGGMLSEEVSVSDLKKGLYILLLHDEGSIYRKKIAIE